MSSSRRIALALLLGLAATQALVAQSPSSSAPAPAPKSARAEQSQVPASVQARIKARREQRRAQAIQDAYGQRWAAFVGTGYRNFQPGPSLGKVDEFPWVIGGSRYFDRYNRRLGVDAEARGYFGTAFAPPAPMNQNITTPTISQYAFLAGPTYRFYLHPKFSLSGRLMAGVEYGHFAGDMGNDQTLSTYLGFYRDGSAFAASAALVGEYNITPAVALRVAPEFYPTAYGSSTQSNFGFTSGIVVRFGNKKK